MPKFMKNKALEILDGALAAYRLGVYGMSFPFEGSKRNENAPFAPVMGLLGASAELLIKACLVQANGIDSMYKSGSESSGVYKYGSDVLNEFRQQIQDDAPTVSFIWKNTEEKENQKEILLNGLNKFKLVQQLRADGLHAGIGCSRDIAVSFANDLYQFILILAKGKRLKPYLKNVPKPNTITVDREALIDDLSRRLDVQKGIDGKMGYLRNMYLVLPYIPENAPDWIENFEKATIVPPTVDDINYLVQTLTNAHSIHLLKSRGGKEGLAVKVEPLNPNAIPVDVQYIKRELNTDTARFNNAVLTANSSLARGQLDLPNEKFLIDLFSVGIRDAAGISIGEKFTAQQAWPFVVSAFSSHGTPRPCWGFVKECDELDQLIALIRRALKYGNGYFKHRSDELIAGINAIKKGTYFDLDKHPKSVYKGYKVWVSKHMENKIANPFTPTFIKQNPVSQVMSQYIQEYIEGKSSAGRVLSKIVEDKLFGDNEKKVIRVLIELCSEYHVRQGLISVLNNDNDQLEPYRSRVRKYMFFSDMYTFGPRVQD